jgi:hypothetical protein
VDCWRKWGHWGWASWGKRDKNNVSKYPRPGRDSDGLSSYPPPDGQGPPLPPPEDENKLPIPYVLH